MRKWLLISLLLAGTAYAQDTTIKSLSRDATRTATKDPADTIPYKWKKGGVFNLNLSQGSLRNWAAGGDEFSLSITSLLSLYAFYKEGRHSWDNTLDVNYGFVRTTSLGSRKNDDRVDLYSKYGYAIAPKWNLATLFNFRTQMLKGYEYPGDDSRVLTSDFLSPAYLLLSLGLDYKPSQNFSVLISPITGRLTLVQNDSLSAKGLYGVEPGKSSEYDVGAFLSANLIKAFTETVTYKGRLDLFSNYRNNPQNIDVYWTNILLVKISRVLAFSWSVDVIYDDDVRLFGDKGTSPATQFKSIIGVGLLVNFSKITAKESP